MGNAILKCVLKCFRCDDDDDYTVTSRPCYEVQYVPALHQPLGPHGVTPATVSVAALANDILSFEITSLVPEALSRHVESSKKAQAKWYKKLLEAWKDAKPPPRTPEEVARLVVRTLNRVQENELKGILAFYGLPIPQISKCDDPSPLPEGVQFELNTLPVNANSVGDGDGLSVYVDTANPRESAIVPLEVQEAVIERKQARAARNFSKADALQKSINDAGYKIIDGPNNEETLARKYRIRLRGIDAPELSQPYGKESKAALAKLLAGKSLKIHVYGEDQYARSIGDVYCNGVFIQEQLLKRGFAWHYVHYDKRPEFAEWEREARVAKRGLFASSNPEKPWDHKRNKRNVVGERNATVQVY